MIDIRERARNYLGQDLKPWRAWGGEGDVLIGICHVVLGEFEKARSTFRAAFSAMFVEPRFWESTRQPDWLVNVCLLSDSGDQLHRVRAELERYRHAQPHPSIVLAYSLALLHVLLDSAPVPRGLLEDMNRRPRYKDGVAMASCIEALQARSTPRLEEAILGLLRAHTGMATRGDLRSTPEGFLCMPAMALTVAAWKRGLDVQVEHRFMSMDYVRFLLGDSMGESITAR